MRSGAVLAACLLALQALPARAQEAGDTPVRIEYEAPDSCPDAAEFERRVRERIQRSRFAKPDEMARTFRVTVTSKPERSVARVEFVDADGEAVSRTIGADTCDEVVNGIALVTALAMEARAGEELPESPPPKPHEPTGEPPPTTPPAAASPAGKPAPRDAWRWDAGIGVDAATGYAPSVAAGLRLFVELAPSFWAVRVTAAHADSGKVSVEGRRARLRYWGGRVEGCPLRLAFAEHLSGIPCVGVDIGALEGQGLPSETIVETREATKLWVAAAAIARLQADLDQFLLLEAQLDARFPFFRHEFHFDNPDSELHTVPVVAFGASVGIGFRFQ